MPSFIDDLLNKITMYRLVLYFLSALLGIAFVLSLVGVLGINPWGLLFSVFAFNVVCWAANTICAKILKVQANVESVYITALILALVITPPKPGAIVGFLPFLFLAGCVAMASKYILNIKNKHIFNPAALAVAFTSLVFNLNASWWVGSTYMLVFVALGGFLVVKKIQRWPAVIAFLASAVLVMVSLSLGTGHTLAFLKESILSSPLIFFAAIMLTEPLTMPPTRDGQIAYALLVGALFAPQTHIGSFYFTPELALLAGNIFSYIISPKGRHMLRLKEKIQVGEGVYDFIFEGAQGLKFKAGQYLEWTLGHNKPDTRGNRRYFTIASSPTENEIILGVKFYERPSTFKQALLNMQSGDAISASQLAGDFTLPEKKDEKLVFIAGGIGITPFRSMLKYLVDKNEKREIVMMYSNRNADELVYRDVLYEASKKLGVKVVCTLTGDTPPDWEGYTGYITPKIIMEEIPDYKQRTFYISGSGTMVSSFKENLLKLGVSRLKIKTDFFPGLV